MPLGVVDSLETIDVHECHDQRLVCPVRSCYLAFQLPEAGSPTVGAGETVDRGMLQVASRGATISRSMVALSHPSIAVSRRVHTVELRLATLVGSCPPILQGLTAICRCFLMQQIHVVASRAGEVPTQLRLQPSAVLIAFFRNLVALVSAQIALLPGLVSLVRPPISFVGCPVTFIGCPVAFIGCPVAFVSCAVALVGCRVAPIARPVPLIGRSIRLRTGRVPLHRRTTALVRDLVALALHLATSRLRVLPGLGSPLARPHGLGRPDAHSSAVDDVPFCTRRATQPIA
jgi:hypothetical protein